LLPPTPPACAGEGREHRNRVGAGDPHHIYPSLDKSSVEAEVLGQK